ncbi:MAG: hypothetical protein WCZ69_00660 [Candidatus Paceibacterota bacterium]
MKLYFEYSPELEIERVKYTIGRLDWYLDNKYSLSSLSFPKKLDLENLRNLSGTEIEEAVKNEYDEQKYLASVSSIQQTFSKYEPALKKLIAELGLPEIPEIKIHLTTYGIGGSYHAPNKVVSNIEWFFGIGLVRNILHEIIHLHIEPLVQKYQVDQWGKETIVNLLFERAFPEIYKKSNIPINTEKIEKTFAKNYPDIEKILSNVSTIRGKSSP